VTKDTGGKKSSFQNDARCDKSIASELASGNKILFSRCPYPAQSLYTVVPGSKCSLIRATCIKQTISRRPFDAPPPTSSPSKSSSPRLRRRSAVSHRCVVIHWHAPMSAISVLLPLFSPSQQIFSSQCSLRRPYSSFIIAFRMH